MIYYGVELNDAGDAVSARAKEEEEAEEEEEADEEEEEEEEEEVKPKSRAKKTGADGVALKDGETQSGDKFRA